MLNLLKGFQLNKIKVKALSLNTKKHFIPINETPSILNDYAELEEFYIDASVTINGAFYNLFSSKSYNITRFDDKKFHKKLADHLDKNSYDIVFCDGLFISVYVDTIKCFAPKSKIVLREHNLEYKIWERLAENNHGLKKIYLKFLTKKLRKYESNVVTKFDSVISLTKIDQEELIQFGAKNTFVNPVGVENQQISIVEPEQNSVFHIGSLDWLPNKEGVIWFLDEVWEEILKEKPDTHFYLAGRNIPDSFFAYAKIKNVHVIGEVENAFDFMQTKNIQIVPLFSGSGMRIKIIEGMSVGKVIVSTLVGAEGIACEHDKNIAISTKSDFANQIIHLLNSPLKSKEIGNNAKLLVENEYSIKSLGLRLKTHLKSLLN